MNRKDLNDKLIPFLTGITDPYFAACAAAAIAAPLSDQNVDVPGFDQLLSAIGPARESLSNHSNTDTTTEPLQLNYSSVIAFSFRRVSRIADPYYRLVALGEIARIMARFNLNDAKKVLQYMEDLIPKMDPELQDDGYTDLIRATTRIGARNCKAGYPFIKHAISLTYKITDSSQKSPRAFVLCEIARLLVQPQLFPAANGRD